MRHEFSRVQASHDFEVGSAHALFFLLLLDPDDERFLVPLDVERPRLGLLLRARAVPRFVPRFV
jgi:hypothetical protein